ncbi:hypothetical protein [Streptomyces jumonjinensis]|uniref:hypothetical protein n=1 Tax=Streptomyces jumonjinensis TaxID=1945 RepID=UPI00378D376E
MRQRVRLPATAALSLRRVRLPATAAPSPRRVRLLVAAALSPLLLGVWAVFAVVAGAVPVAGGTVVSAVSAAPAAPARTDAHQRGAFQRSEVRRAPAVAVQEAVAADPGNRPPPLPAAPAAPEPFAHHRPLIGGESAGPRHERAPPRPAHGPRHTRAPPATPSS